MTLSYVVWSAVALLLAFDAGHGQSLRDPLFRVGTGTDGPVDAIALQVDNRILVGGEFTVINGYSNSHLARLNVDGSVDASFTTGQTDGSVRFLQPLPDGKILVGGDFNILLGQERHGVARLGRDGCVDPAFDAGMLLGSNACVWSVATQDDGRIVIGGNYDPMPVRIIRVMADGHPDDTFTFTNQYIGYLFSMLSVQGGRILAGINPWRQSADDYSLVLLETNGSRCQESGPLLETNSSVFALARQNDGKILVGERLFRKGDEGKAVPLLRLNADLTWDPSFQPDEFEVGGGDQGMVNSLCIQADGKIVVGGTFVDPGMGLGGSDLGPVRRIVEQQDGSLMVGGLFQGVDGENLPNNLIRFLPMGACDSVRVFVGFVSSTSARMFAAATFPPGATNILEHSGNLLDWQELVRGTEPYLYYPTDGPIITSVPTQYFRARQER